MSLFSRLFGARETGAKTTPDQKPVIHEGFSIYPDPIKEGTHWRLAARIEKDIAGEVRTHHLIRADTLDSHDTAAEASLDKAKQVIDEQGDAIFG